MIDISRIEEAYTRILGIANTTPTMTSRTLDGMVKASIFLKCENFQRAGSFKFRGAYNAVSMLSSEEKSKGVIAHSSGNHAQALALAAQLENIHCTVVMPENSSKMKMEAASGYGAEVVMCGPSLSPERRPQIS